MFPIVNKQTLANSIKRIDIHAPNIARKSLPGQFVSVSPEEGDERIPLSVVDTDPAKGIFSLIFQEVGPTTKKLGEMAIREKIFSILGPLGIPSVIQMYGEVICVATGVGAVQILPICRALRKLGNKVTGIFGANTKRQLLLEPQLRLTCNKLYLTTDDGSYERKGKATDVLEEIINKRQVHCIYAIGAVDMMQMVVQLAQAKRIPTRIHLNPFMVDCMGMCGSCRVKIGNERKLTCIDGPEFDGHLVDFKDVRIRMNAFKEPIEWQEHKSSPRNQPGESKIFKRLLSGLLKE